MPNIALPSGGCRPEGRDDADPVAGGRFRFGLGAGESFNEHVVGKGWPSVGTRHEMFSEAVDIIVGLFDNDGAFTFHGKHYNVDTAVLWDKPKPEVRVSIGIAVSGERAEIEAAEDIFALEARLLERGRILRRLRDPVPDPDTPSKVE